MSSPFYQIKLAVNGVYVEYTTTDREAMDKFITGESNTPSPVSSVPANPLNYLSRALKGVK